MRPTDPFSDYGDQNDKTVIRPSPGRRRPQPPTAAPRRHPAPPMAEDGQRSPTLEGDNPLIDSAFSLLSLVPKLRNLPFHHAVNELQERLVEEIKQFETRALGSSVSKNEVDIAKYLLCSLIDETVLNTPWGSQSGWGHNSLSSLFYKKLVGGEEFFQILEKLKQQPGQNQDLLELAYLCMSLGFEGKYRYTNNGLLALERERQELYLLIQRTKGDPPKALSVQWEGLRNLQNPLIRHVPLWVLAGVSGVILMLVYMIFAFGIRDNSDRLYEELYTMAQEVEETTPLQLVRPLQVQRVSTFTVDRLKQLLANEETQKKVAVVDGPIIRIFNMFPSGSASVRTDYQAILAKVARALEKENASMLVIGHTDNQKIKFSTRFKSNWHLSVARAESAARTISQFGFPAKRIQFEGKADKDPIAPNNTRANRALNRRIDIHIR